MAAGGGTAGGARLGAGAAARGDAARGRPAGPDSRVQGPGGTEGGAAPVTRIRLVWCFWVHAFAYACVYV